MITVSNRTRRAFLRTAGATTVLGAAAAAMPASAGPPLTGSGEGKIIGLEIPSSCEAGGNRFEDRILEGTVDGTLDGTFVQNTSGMVHKSDRVVFRGSMTFTGILEDCGEGSINLAVSGRGHIPERGFPITEASVRVVNQAANTIDVTGTGVVFQRGLNLTYEIRYKFRK